MDNEINTLTPEAQVEKLASSLTALQAEKSELQKSFEALAAEKMASNEEASKLKAEFEAHKLQAETEKTELTKLLAEAQANQVTASKEAAKVISNLGMKPVDVSPADKLATEEATDAKSVWATFLKMKAGTEKQAYFRKHKAILDPLNLS
jgi:outer membrane murein-binding lipoprotein Lpp